MPHRVPEHATRLDSGGAMRWAALPVRVDRDRGLCRVPFPVDVCGGSWPSQGASTATPTNRSTDNAPMKIYQKVQSRGIAISHACEVGVYLPHTSNIIDFINAGTRASLVEADPETVAVLHDTFRDRNVTVYPVAVWSSSGTVRMSRAASSTFVSELESSPAIVNDQYQVEADNTFEVRCVLFSEIDQGDIDLLSVDIEGAEWNVIQHLTSRPKVISVETHGKYYVNPRRDDILTWMRDHSYLVWYKDTSDTVFIRSDVGAPSFGDRVGTMLTEARSRWRRLRGMLRST